MVYVSYLHLRYFFPRFPFLLVVANIMNYKVEKPNFLTKIMALFCAFFFFFYIFAGSAATFRVLHSLNLRVLFSSLIVAVYFGSSGMCIFDCV